MSHSGNIELHAGEARAILSLSGAEWLGWSIGGRSLLWTPDGVHWDRVAPVLFPVCGWTRDAEIRVDGQVYPLGLHGFAAGQTFSVVDLGADYVTFRLIDSSETRGLYPFRFILELSFRLLPTSMEVTGVVRKSGARPMPYAIGFHPGFCWPLVGGAQDEYQILFDAPESSRVPVITPTGLFSRKRRKTGHEGRELRLSEATFAREALCFLNAASKALTFEGPGGRLRVEAEGLAHILLWSRPGAPFLCIENCSGYGDPEGFTGELAAKPSMILLDAGQVCHHSVRYSFAP